MQFLFLIFFGLIITLFLILFSKKTLLLLHISGDTHQNFIKSVKTPLIGGIAIFLYFFLDYKNINSYFLFLFFILIVGILSDLKIIKSANFRLIIQFLILLAFIIITNIGINDTRIILLDQVLQNKLFFILFPVICTLIVINGSNFIDGTNINTIGYFLSLELIFYYLGGKDLIIENPFEINYFLIILIILFLFNSFNKLYLGDSGSYLLGFIYSVKCIYFYDSNSNISPYFITLLLWYPAFEIFFSIIRKLNFNKSPLKPDTNHLHQLIYFFLEKKITNTVLASSSVGLLISLYNLIIFSIALRDLSNTQYQIILIFLNIFIYSFVYIRLLKIKSNKLFF